MADSRRPRDEHREAGESRRSRWDRSSREGGGGGGSSRWDKSSSSSSSHRSDQSHRHDRSPPDRSYRERSPDRSYRDRSPVVETSRHHGRLFTEHRDPDHRSDRHRSAEEIACDVDDRHRFKKQRSSDAARRSPDNGDYDEPRQKAQSSHPTGKEDPIERLFREYEKGNFVKPQSAEPGLVPYSIPQLAAYNDMDDRRSPDDNNDNEEGDLDGQPLPDPVEAAPMPKFSGFGIMTRQDHVANNAGSSFQPKKPVAPIKMSLGVQKPKGPPALKKTAAVASIFGEDDDSEEEEMPAAAKMRMRNIGRETPTAAGPNSFGKGRLGFCDRQKIIQREIQRKMDGSESKT